MHVIEYYTEKSNTELFEHRNLYQIPHFQKLLKQFTTFDHNSRHQLDEDTITDTVVDKNWKVQLVALIYQGQVDLTEKKLTPNKTKFEFWSKNILTYTN